jgi:hypothetical protein
MWGAIIGIVMALYVELTYEMSTGIKLAGYLLFFGGLVAAKMQFRDKVNQGYASFGKLYGLGMLIALVAGVVAVIHFFIFIKIHPTFVDDTLAQNKAMMIMYKVPDDQIESSLRRTRWFLENPIGITIGNIIGQAFFGAILSLLSAGITARNKPIFSDDEINPAQ